jgi:hypothetical protein
MAEAAGIMALLRGDRAQRSAAFAELRELARNQAHAPHAGRIAAAAESSPPLLDLLAEPATRVDAAEYVEAGLLLDRLILMDPLQIGGRVFTRIMSGERFAATDSAFALMHSKGAAEITREDVLLGAADAAPILMLCCKGFSAVASAAGSDDAEIFGAFAATHPCLNQSVDEIARQSALIALEICREQANLAVDSPHHLAPRHLAGVWFYFFWLIAGRLPIIAEVIKAGMFTAGVATLRKHNPSELVSWRTDVGQIAAGVALAFREVASHPPGINSAQVIIESGAAELTISMLEALEKMGASKITDGNPLGLVHMLQMIVAVDLSAPDAAPIFSMLQAIPSALRFAIDFPLVHLAFTGITTASLCAMVSALVFGKAEGEDSALRFSLATIDVAVENQQGMMSGAASHHFALSAHFFRPMLHLCISDSSKALLVQSPKLLPMICEALLLDPEHVKKDADASIQAAVQADAAECLLQIAVFAPGRALMESDGATIEALRALANGQAMTEEAAVSANGVSRRCLSFPT